MSERKDAVPYGVEVKDHLERDVQTICAYCGSVFDIDELVIEKEIHGRIWKFCNDECYHDFMDALDFKDEDLDSYEVGKRINVDE